MAEGEINTVYKCLKEALLWWEKDAQYMTTGDYGDRNVFDDDPDWVIEARVLFEDLEHL